MHKLLLVFSITLAMHAQTIHVDAQGPANGNGSAQSPFNSLPAAVAYANTLEGSPAIHVAPGRYELTDTLRIEKGLTLQGSNELEIDEQGWPTGNLVDPAKETRIVGGPALIGVLISAGKAGEVIEGVKLRGLTFQSGPRNGNVLDFARVQDFEVRDSILTGFTTLPAMAGSGINTFASSGTIRGTYTTRLLGAAFIGAGYAGSPAEVVFRGNRAVGNRVGIFLVGTSDGITEPGDQLYAVVRDNDLSYNYEQRPSAGIRVIVKGTEHISGPGYGSTGLSTGNVHATIRNNRLVGNKIGIVIDGAFVTRQQPAPPANVCDTRTFSGLLDLSFRENTLSDSTFKPALISFTQLQTTLSVLEGNPPPYAQFQFLHITTFTIDDPDHVLAGAYIDHPATDPFVGGTCSLDTIHEELHNTLRINGSLVDNTAP